MALQDRAIRTKRQLLEGAAAVFNRRGYDAATIQEILDESGLTKGSLYYHFESKEELAVAVMKEQVVDIKVAPQSSKLQEFVDAGQALAHQLRDDVLQQAAARMSTEQASQHLDRTESMGAWTNFVIGLLTEARARGELLVSVDIQQTAEMYVGAFAGLQMMSQAVSGRQDLSNRLRIFFSHTMPSIATPTALAQLDLSCKRGAEVAKVAAKQLAVDRAMVAKEDA
ncbi:ScbR family autoregulator-binding transcription factor [Streptomyces sp. NPDC048650]|uniref:ScbR family autoregulator-binding transcription factor n=1 Tax=unclassified Streptomyces TaxID=2593676 RepID=UPI00372225AE